jgi:hypothetical protein
MRIFISYAEPDRDFALMLSERLKRAGHDVWLDIENLYPGDNWQLAIGQALEDSEAIVALVSPEWVNSEVYNAQFAYALGGKKYKDRLIPVLVRPTEEFPPAVRMLNMMDSRGDVDQTSREIVKRLSPGPAEAVR